VVEKSKLFQLRQMEGPQSDGGIPGQCGALGKGYPGQLGEDLKYGVTYKCMKWPHPVLYGLGTASTRGAGYAALCVAGYFVSSYVTDKVFGND
jgi:hypothetical protein